MPCTPLSFQPTVLCASGAPWEADRPGTFPLHNRGISQLILDVCQARYCSHLWDHHSTAQLRIFIPSVIEYHTVSMLHQLILVCPPTPHSAPSEWQSKPALGGRAAACKAQLLMMAGRI